jgi:hypothetical protein
MRASACWPKSRKRKERVHRYHIAGVGELERACVKLKLVSLGTRRTIRFNNLNDPRLGGRVRPMEGGG